MSAVASARANDISERVAALPWEGLRAALDEDGFAETPALLTPAECETLAGLFDEARFRSSVDMRRHRYGDGEYRYFANPLPTPVDGLRHAFYAQLAPVANAWASLLGEPADFPAELGGFLARCHAAGQERPTPLLLRYGPGGHNALHQDVYGEVAFPLQVVTVLSRTGSDFSGGQLVLVEQRPRAQSRAHVIDLAQGAFLIFPNQRRPARGSRGHHRVAMRHGVATVRSGQRVSLGLIFHDAA